MSIVSQAEQPRVIASALLDKARRLGLSLPLDLERLAVARGCHYYDRELPPRVPPLGEVRLSNNEIAIALIAPSLNPSAREIRLAAKAPVARETGLLATAGSVVDRARNLIR